MSTKEIHKIRRKFIIVSMLSFFVVIFSIGALINGVNYLAEEIEIEFSLKEILDKKHTLEDDDVFISELQDEFSIGELFSPTYQRNIFYIFTFDPSNKVVSFFASKGNTYRDDVIQQKAYAIMTNPSTNGQQGMYYYMKNELPNGNIELAMLDCSYIIYSRERLLYASMAVGFLGLMAALILVIIFSKKAIEPEIKNNEKQIQFLTNVSHELKTPLAVIQSNAELEEITKGESEYTKSTIRQVNRMNGLIKSLVMISKTKEKSDTNMMSSVDISGIAAETLKEFEAMASSENKNIVNEIETGLVIRSDESTIRQLVMILIDNAIKYCDDNGTITVRLESIKRGKSNVRLTVSNNYIEGAKIDYNRFFDRFYREDESHNIDKAGYGIGLSIAKNICEQNNGDISAEWKDGVISFVCELR